MFVNQVGKVGRVQVRPGGNGEGLELLAHTQTLTETHRHSQTHIHLYVHIVGAEGEIYACCSIFSCFCDYPLVTKKYLLMLAGFRYSISTKKTKKFTLTNIFIHLVIFYFTFTPDSSHQHLKVVLFNIQGPAKEKTGDTFIILQCR